MTPHAGELADLSLDASFSNQTLMVTEPVAALKQPACLHQIHDPGGMVVPYQVCTT